MPTKLPTTPPTQEFLAALAAQPTLPWWKRVLNRIFAPESQWHRSRTGYGYSATWTTVSSDGTVSQTNRKVRPEPAVSSSLAPMTLPSLDGKGGSTASSEEQS
jgi:hypothetical protein